MGFRLIYLLNSMIVTSFLSKQNTQHNTDEIRTTSTLQSVSNLPILSKCISIKPFSQGEDVLLQLKIFVERGCWMCV